MQTYQVEKLDIDGKFMWVVSRADGKKITEDGIVSYNFHLQDFCCAYECLVMLETNINPKFDSKLYLEELFRKGYR